MDYSIDPLDIDKSFYKKALENEDYFMIKYLFENDPREKNTVLSDIFEVFDYEDRTHYNDKKFTFIEIVSTQQMEILIDEYFLNNLTYIEEYRFLIMDFVRNNDLLSLKQFMKENRFQISYYNNESMDLLIFSIENNVSLSFIDFLCRNYKNLNYVINDISVERTPLFTAIAQNKFRIADTLIKYGADINYKIKNEDLYNYLNNFQLINNYNFRYLLRQSSKLNIINSRYISNLIESDDEDDQQRLTYIFEDYCYNIKFILDLLSLYQNKVSLSKDEFDERIKNERDKIEISYSLYKKAITYERYSLLEKIYNCDTRKKQDILNDLFSAFSEDEIHNDDQRKIIFIEKIKSNDLNIPVDNYFTNNLYYIGERRKIINDYIKNNQFYEFKNYIEENKFHLCYYNYDDNNLLILALENDVSYEFIEYIINYYDNLNFFVKGFKSPLYEALSHSNFRVSNLLLENGADINYIIDDEYIINCLYNHQKLNNKILFYIMNHGFNYDYNFIRQDVMKLDHFVTKIFPYYIYDNKRIINILYYSKNKVSLSDSEFRGILNHINIKNFDDEFFDEALANDNSYAIHELLKYDTRELNYHLEKYCNQILKTAVITGDYKMIDEVINCQEFDMSTIEFCEIITYEPKITMKRYKRILKYLIEKIFLHQSFTINKKCLDDILDSIKEFRNVDFVRYLINKIYNHKTFELTNTNLRLIMTSIEDSKISKYVNFWKYLIKKTYHHHDFTFEKINFEKIIHYVRYWDLDLFKYIINISYTHKTFDLKNENIENYLSRICYIFKNSLTDYLDEEQKVELIKYFIDKTYNHKTFDLNNEIFRGFLSTISNYGDMELFKYFIEKSFHYPTFYFKEKELKSCFTLINENANEMYRDYRVYFFKELLSLKTYKFDSEEFLNILFKYYNEDDYDLVELLINQLFQSDSVDINSLIFEPSFHFNYESKNTFIMELIIENIFDHKSSMEKTNFEEFLMKINQYNNYYLMKLVIEGLCRNKSYDLKSIPFEKIILKTAKDNHFSIMELIIHYLRVNPNYDFSENINIKDILLIAIKNDNTRIIQFLLEQLLDLTIDLEKEYLSINLPCLKTYDHQIFELIHKSLIRLGNESLVKCFIERQL